MDSVQVIVLALLQGLVEFLPISSSGHLILVPALAGWPDQGLGFDIAVHLGTLIAVVVYFRRELGSLAVSVFQPDHPQARLTWALLLGTAPLVLAGLLVAEQASDTLRSPMIIAATTAGFGVLLWAADRFARGQRSERDVGWREALMIGCGQALALVPGTSRSGITMTVGMALGLSRQGAARFSFLLAAPAIGGAAIWQLWQFTTSPEPVIWGTLAVAAGVAAATAFAAIALFLRLIERVGMLVFALYRLALAGVITYVFL